MRIGVIHHSLNSTGGGERVCLSLIKALKNKGFDVVLATTEKTEWDVVEKRLGCRVDVEEVSFLPFRLRMFGIYQRLLTGFLTPALKRSVDIIINTHGDMIFGFADITYMHYPVIALKYEKPEVYVKYRQNIFWRSYFAPYEVMQKTLLKMFLKNSLILTNSKYSARAIRKYLRRNSFIIYPPVDVEFFRTNLDKKENNLVLSVGRYTPEKRYELIPLIAKECKDAEFVVVGSVSLKAEPYYQKVKSLVEKYGCKNVKLLRNIPLEELKELYARASIYLHLMAGEHFGISVVEAMSAGCVPLVHRSGGPWLDIVDQGKYGFAYGNVKECCKKINELTKMDLSSMRKKIQKRSQDFSEEKFQEKIIKIIEEYLKLVS
nr:glycosyltransferase [Candidatus Baldrarchaeota archaeon]